jgi:hypothetical protein
MPLNVLTLSQELPMPGMGAGAAARMYMKSNGVNPEDPYGVNPVTEEVMKSLKSQGIDANPELVHRLVGEALKSGVGGLVQKATDPVILPQPFVAPTDFNAQYPQPLDPTEILTLCEEISTWKALPEVVTKKLVS